MRIQRKSGYSSEIAKKYVDESKDLFFISSFEEVQHKYENDKRTDEIAAYKYWFAQDGLNAFQVKFEKEIKSMPAFLSKVKLIELEGVEVRGHVYFKAKSVEVTD